MATLFCRRQGAALIPQSKAALIAMEGLLHGVYHHASPKHLDRYVAEFTFRLNDGAVQRHTLDRLASMFSATIGQRLTYKDLIA